MLGPEDISYDEQAAVLSEVLGREVRYEQIPIETHRANLLARGTFEAMAQGVIDMALAKNAGLDAGVVRTPEFSTPTTFRQWCQDVLVPATA
ncbi:Rossmann-fold NAD(P)-binding domain-containing protein [Kineosporia babensis]|uniref:NmrA-like domain-containing protein n=1 Tax=Kineosporia babensis TaxID=499548 RepID=A0A9X1NFZ1_9ACTN|nr:hypothetical protein [Kineosporia babensis]MCD5314402.1 hypothetical protein [Kineosporia babensis]